jgi:hypothetical protein
LPFDALTTPEQLNLLERVECVRRQLPASEYELINQIADHAIRAEIGGPLPQALADRLRITKTEAARRFA